MFDQLLSRQFHILRHRSGPYSEERQTVSVFLDPGRPITKYAAGHLRLAVFDRATAPVGRISHDSSDRSCG